MTEILVPVLVLGATGVLAALLLSWVSRRFAVREDPRIAEIEELLPGANCGGCGYSGCHAFAAACASATSLDSMNCPGAGKAAMARIGEIVGLDAGKAEAKVAVVRCGGTCAARPRTAVYDGPRSCTLLAATGVGDSACVWGCLGMGDCVAACPFGAMAMDPYTGLPLVDDTKCVGCGVCVSACPRGIITLLPKGPRGLRVWVACGNHDKGAAAIKVCKNACLGCGKCVKVCGHNAITVTDNLAVIDPSACRLCRKCVDTCPTDAIHCANFPTAHNTIKESDS